MVLKMRIFKNKKTGKKIELDEDIDSHLIKDLEKDKDFKELMNI